MVLTVYDPGNMGGVPLERKASAVYVAPQHSGCMCGIVVFLFAIEFVG